MNADNIDSNLEKLCAIKTSSSQSFSICSGPSHYVMHHSLKNIALEKKKATKEVMPANFFFKLFKRKDDIVNNSSCNILFLSSTHFETLLSTEIGLVFCKYFPCIKKSFFNLWHFKFNNQSGKSVSIIYYCSLFPFRIINRAEMQSPVKRSHMRNGFHKKPNGIKTHDESLKSIIKITFNLTYPII